MTCQHHKAQRIHSPKKPCWSLPCHVFGPRARAHANLVKADGQLQWRERCQLRDDEQALQERDGVQPDGANRVRRVRRQPRQHWPPVAVEKVAAARGLRRLAGADVAAAAAGGRLQRPGRRRRRRCWDVAAFIRHLASALEEVPQHVEGTQCALQRREHVLLSRHGQGPQRQGADAVRQPVDGRARNRRRQGDAVGRDDGRGRDRRRRWRARAAVGPCPPRQRDHLAGEREGEGVRAPEGRGRTSGTGKGKKRFAPQAVSFSRSLGPAPCPR